MSSQAASPAGGDSTKGNNHNICGREDQYSQKRWGVSCCRRSVTRKQSPALVTTSKGLKNEFDGGGDSVSRGGTYISYYFG
jgi:hypothetical protein